MRPLECIGCIAGRFANENLKEPCCGVGMKFTRGTEGMVRLGGASPLLFRLGLLEAVGQGNSEWGAVRKFGESAFSVQNDGAGCRGRGGRAFPTT